MSELPRKESPLAQCRLPARRRDGVRAGVVLKEQKFQVQMNLRGDPGDDAFISAVEGELGIPLPLQANTISHKHDLVIAWLGPDEWLLIANPETGLVIKPQLERSLSGLHCSLNDLSGGQTIISVSGPRSLDVLAKGCTLDLHPRVFGPSQCAQSHLAKSSVLIIPRISNLTAYDVVVRRSFADYLWQWLVKAAREFGVDPA